MEPLSYEHEREMEWVDSRLVIALKTYQRACELGHGRLARRWFTDAVRLTGYLWLERVLEREPCRLHRPTVALAWRAYERTTTNLAGHGLLITLTDQLR